MKIHHKTCILMLIKKCIFSVNHGKIAYGIAKILGAVQRTHTSNVPRSPLYISKQETEHHHQ